MLLIKFAFTVCDDLDGRTVIPLLRLADYWSVAALRELCRYFVFGSLKGCEHVTAYIALTGEFGLKRLRN